MAMRIKVKTLKFIPAMFFDNGIIPGIGWFQSRGKDIENSGDIYLMKYLDINLSWFLNKNFFTYVDYKINQLDKNTPFSISTDDTFGVGMTWQFNIQPPRKQVRSTSPDLFLVFNVQGLLRHNPRQGMRLIARFQIIIQRRGFFKDPPAESLSTAISR